MKTLDEWLTSRMDESAGKSGDRKLDSKYKEIEEAKKLVDSCQKVVRKTYDNICKNLGIKTTKIMSKHSAENRKKVEIDPEYKKAYKTFQNANEKYAKLAKEFKRMYIEYIKNGGKQIKDYYIAAHEWDDGD